MTTGESSGRHLIATTAMPAVVAYGALATLHVVLRQVAGDATWWLWLANLLALLLWAPAVAGLLLVVLGRRWLPAVLACLVPAVAWIWTFGPFLAPAGWGSSAVAASSAPSDPSTSTGAGRQIRMVAWNVRPRNPGRDLAALIDETDPDVMLLQEVLPRFRDRVIAAAPGLPYNHFATIAPKAYCCGQTVVLSRWPVVGTRDVGGLPERARTVSIVTLDVDGTLVDVVPVHLASPTPDGPTHIGTQARLRTTETRVIVAALAADRARPLILGGDLNSSTANAPRRLLLGAGLTDLQATSGSGLGTTRRKLRVDWLFARGVTPVRAWPGNARNSDHRPVLADVRLP